MSSHHSPRASRLAHHTELEMRRMLERRWLLPLLSLCCVCCSLWMMSSSLTLTLQKDRARAHQWLFDAARDLPQLSAQLTPQERSRRGLIRRELIWEPGGQQDHPYVPHRLKTLSLAQLSAGETKGRSLRASHAGDQAWYEAYATQRPQWSDEGALWSVRELSRSELKELNAPRSAHLISNPERPARLVTRVASPTLPTPDALPHWIACVVVCGGCLISRLWRIREIRSPWRAALGQALWVSLWLSSCYPAPSLIYMWKTEKALTSLALRLQLAPLKLLISSEGLWETVTLVCVSCVILMWLGLWLGLWASPPQLKRKAHI